MSLLGELVLSFLVESALLAGVWVGIAVAAAWATSGLSFPWPARTFVVALIGAMVAGSLARRFGLPTAWELDLGKRELPVLWSMGGALAGPVLAAVRRPGARAGASTG